MILRSIGVENWRCFVDPIEIDNISEGITVLHAPNGVGKTTLFRALVRGLIDNHNVKSKGFEKTYRPWGRSLPPKVWIKFSEGGIDYRITKQFLDSPRSVLERREDGRFTRLMEGSEADRRVREILASTGPARGLAKTVDWGWAQVLWAPQGKLDFKDLSGNLVEDIETALGAQSSDTSAGPVEERIEKRFLQYYAPKGGLRKGKDGAPEVRIEEDLDTAKERLRKAVEEQTRYEEASRTIEDIRATRASSAREVEALARTLEEARTRAQEHDDLLAERELLRAQSEASQATHTGIEQSIASIREVRRGLEESEASLKKFTEEKPLREKEIGDRRARFAQAETAVENIRKSLPEIEEAYRMTEEARKFLEADRLLADVDTLLHRIGEAEAERDRLREERKTFLAPSESDLQRYRQLEKLRDDERVRIEAAFISLEITAEREGRLTVLEGEGRGGEVDLQPDLPTRIEGTPKVVVEVPGVGRFRAWGRGESVEEHRETLARTEKEIEELATPFGAESSKDLEASFERSRALEAKIAESERTIETLLDGKNLSELRTEGQTHRAIRESYFDKNPAWRETKPRFEDLLSDAHKKDRAFKERIDPAEAERETSRAALQAAESAFDRFRLENEMREDKRKELEQQLDNLIADGKTDEERADELAKAAMSWQASRGRIAEIDAALEKIGEDPTKTVQSLETQIERARETADSARDRENSEEGRLQTLSAEGTYSKRAEAEEEVTRLEQSLREERLKTKAIRLLHKTVRAEKENRLAAILDPVEKEATRILRRIMGGRLGDLKLAQGFEPEGMTPPLLEGTAPTEQLSGGEGEQVYLATRLALAETLSRQERRLVVLDDTLTSTDGGRLARIMTVLEEASENLQILILTCHRERYGGLSNARFIDLDEAVRESRRRRGEE